MDDVGLPKSSLQKAIKDALPGSMRIAGDASELLVQACNQFVHLISTQANDISERDKRSTITPEHVIRALEELEFGPQYTGVARAALEEWKAENKEHHDKMQHRKQGSGLTQQQMIELQQRLFEEARAATLSGPLPSMAVAAAMAEAAAAGPGGEAPAAAGASQEQQQEQAAAAAPPPPQQHQREQGQQEEQQQAATQGQPAAVAAGAEAGNGGAGDDMDAALSDDEEVQAAVS